MASPTTRRVMLDLSVLVDPSFRDVSANVEGLNLRAPATREMIVIPQTALDVLREPEDDFEQLFGHVAQPDVLPLLTDLPTFSHRQAAFAHASHEEVRAALLFEERGRLGALFADEWAFLQSESTLLSKLRRPLEAFRDAGAAVIELGHKAGRELIQQVIPKDHLPEALTARIFATAAAKWIILGGATVGGGTLGGVAGTAIAGPTGAAWGSKAAGFAVGKATTAALLAIDPHAVVTPTARLYES